MKEEVSISLARWNLVNQQVVSALIQFIVGRDMRVCVLYACGGERIAGGVQVCWCV